MADHIVALVLSRTGCIRPAHLHALRSAGYVVIQSSDTAEFIRLGRSWIPHLVLIDFADKDEARILLKIFSEERALSASSFLFITRTLFSDNPAGFGAVHLLNAALPMPLFMEKVRAALRFRKGLSRSFTGGAHVSAQITLKGVVEKLDKNGFTLKAPIKLAPLANPQIRSPLFNELHLEDCLFQKNSKEAFLVQAECYQNEISVVGIHPACANQLYASTSRSYAKR